MVYAFIVHTLLPGACKVLFHNIYGNDNACVDLNASEEIDSVEIRKERKQQIQIVADQVSGCEQQCKGKIVLYFLSCSVVCSSQSAFYVNLYRAVIGPSG